MGIKNFPRYRFVSFRALFYLRDLVRNIVWDFDCKSFSNVWTPLAQTVELQGRASVHKAGSIQGGGTCNPSVAVQLRDLDDVS